MPETQTHNIMMTFAVDLDQMYSILQIIGGEVAPTNGAALTIKATKTKTTRATKPAPVAEDDDLEEDLTDEDETGEDEEDLEDEDDLTEEDENEEEDGTQEISRDQLLAMSVKDLKLMCAKNGLEITGKVSKADMVNALTELGEEGELVEDGEEEMEEE